MRGRRSHFATPYCETTRLILSIWVLVMHSVQCDVEAAQVILVYSMSTVAQ